jgi:hypothetical protein
MILDWNALGAAGSFGQFLVVLVAAILALRQLDHLRRQSELDASIPHLRENRTPQFLDTMALVGAVADGGDEQLRAVIDGGHSTDPRLRQIFMLGMFFNELGLLVEKGLIRGDTILPLYRQEIITTWAVTLPMVRRGRAGREGSMWAPFEALAVRARAINVEGRFSEIRASLPASLRADFDHSLAQTQSSTTAQRGASAQDDHAG